MAKIESQAELDAVLASPAHLLFKHSYRCGISDRAHQQVEAYLADDPAVPVSLLDVVAQRPLARGVAETIGVEHQSPQVILLRDGKPVWHASQFDVTKEALREAVAS